ncbi:hypothetical protein [Tropicimonas marinistellae]|uniref:hypothetical protein n=1 Tax=Tropicimonas marinistellae TaxID=1739787 RepID=UPI000834C838|nr:hypothetical protein [Tropicimonas marinistellae]
MSEEHTPPTESLEPFTGDRGWKGLARAEGEVALFGIVAVLLVVAVLTALSMGVAGVGVLFVLLTFVSLALLIVISVGG